MSRIDKFEDILNGYDEKFQQSWKAFLQGFDEKYCSILSQFDDATKQKLVNGYHLIIESSEKTKNNQLIEIYYKGMKSLIDVKIDSLDLIHDQAVMRSYIDGVEEIVRSFEK